MMNSMVPTMILCFITVKDSLSIPSQFIQNVSLLLYFIQSESGISEGISHICILGPPPKPRHPKPQCVIAAFSKVKWDHTSDGGGYSIQRSLRGPQSIIEVIK